MNMKSFILTLYATFFFFISWAQQKPMLTGMVVDGEGEGVIFVYVALIQQIGQQQKVVSFTSSSLEGRFSLPVAPNGNYSLFFSCLGYTDRTYDIVVDDANLDLGTFILEEGVLLTGTVVTARREVVRAAVDRLVYDVSKDTTAARLSMLQLLDKIPFIKVDPVTKGIKVMGQDGGYSITVNGKKNLLVSEANQYVQEMMNGGRLKEIELITSPEGQYSGQNAVINFVTTSSLPDGFAARISATGSNAYEANSSIGITSKIGRFVFDVSGGFNYSDLFGTESWTKRTNYTSSDYRNIDNYIRNDPKETHRFMAELRASYDMSSLDLVTFRAKISPSNAMTDITSHTDYTNIAGVATMMLSGNSRNTANSNPLELGLNWQHSFKNSPGRLLTFTYGYDNRSNNQDYKTENIMDGEIESYYTSRNKTGNEEHTAAVDFYSPLSNGQSYYLTGKYVHRSYGSEAWQRNLSTLTSIDELLDAMDYTQQVGSVKGSYSYRGAKLMVTAEAAAEYAFNDISFRTNNTAVTKGYFTWLTLLRLTYRPTSRSNFIFSLSRDTYRPDILLLNPYEDHSVPGQIQKGNPDIDNANNYSTMLIFNFFLNKELNIRLSSVYRYSDKTAHAYTYVDEDGLFVTTYANSGKQQFANFVLSLDYNPISWLQMSLMGTMRYNQFEYPQNRNSYWNQSVMFSTTANLWKGGFFSGNVDYANPDWLTSWNMQSQKLYLRLSGYFSLSQNLNKNWRIRASVSNPWETYSLIKIEEGASDFYSYREERRFGRTFSINLTYTFGRFGERVKNSQRTVVNTDRERM